MDFEVFAIQWRRTELVSEMVLEEYKSGTLNPPADSRAAEESLERQAMGN